MGSAAFNLEPSAYLRPSDISDLRWYFGAGGSDQFRASTMGAMLYLAELYAFRTETCGTCDGCGFVASSKERRAITEYQAMLLGLIGEAATLSLPPLADQQCHRCLGMGYTVRRGTSSRSTQVTVRETGSSIPTGGADCMPVDANIARLGLVSSRLSKLPQLAAMALEAYYSPGGESLLALWELTPAGKTMLRGNGMSLPARQFFANRRAEQEMDFRGDRAAQFSEADTQSEELLRATCRAWNEAIRGKQ
jgi:hypothetical protein